MKQKSENFVCVFKIFKFKCKNILKIYISKNVNQDLSLQLKINLFKDKFQYKIYITFKIFLVKYKRKKK